MQELQDIIEAKLLTERKIFLWGQVDDSSAKHVIERLLYLEASAKNKEIQLIINSPGGMVTSGFAIHDTMQSISSPVSTICTGLAASMGSILLSAGQKGKRFVYPNARVMIHQPSGGANGRYSDVKIQLDEILKIKRKGAELLAQNCGQTAEKILEDFDRDYWLDANEALEYGIIDAIL